MSQVRWSSREGSDFRLNVRPRGFNMLWSAVFSSFSQFFESIYRQMASDRLDGNVVGSFLGSPWSNKSDAQPPEEDNPRNLLFSSWIPARLGVKLLQVNNYEIVGRFFHICHNLTWYSAIVHFTRIYPVCSTYELKKQFM